jgi:hypothetical protein
VNNQCTWLDLNLVDQTILNFIKITYLYDVPSNCSIVFNSSLLGLDNLPDLEDLESKLNAYYAKVEKDTGLSKG